MQVHKIFESPAFSPFRGKIKGMKQLRHHKKKENFRPKKSNKFMMY